MPNSARAACMIVSLTAQNTSLIFSESAGERGVRQAEMVVTCGAGEMTVDNFLRVRIQVDEHPEDELPGSDGVPLRAYSGTQGYLL